jgi:hypothetical protein
MALTLLVGACSEPTDRAADPRLQQLASRRTALESARPDAVTVYGPDHRAVQLIDRQIELVDTQIAMYKQKSRAGASYGG